MMTVLNAPFDWLSVGLTRALLRRGLDKGGWAPFRLSLIDATLAVFLVTALVPVMVVGVQFFDGIAELGGGHAILPLKSFFDGIEANPFAPEFWWVYALILSTLIPSLLNLSVGGFSMVRVLSGISPCLLDHLPADCAVTSYNRPLIALCLTAQMVAGIFIGFAILTLFVSIIIAYILPTVGLGLLNLARLTADIYIPGLFGLH
jgi:hypothetical protein